jgi:hypothetical protein
MSSAIVDEYDEIFASDDAFLAGLSDTDLQPSESLSGAGYVMITHICNLYVLVFRSIAHPAPSHSAHSTSVPVQDGHNVGGQHEDMALYVFKLNFLS